MLYVFGGKKMKGLLNCPCGCGLQMQEIVIRFLIELEKVFLAETKKEIYITSSARCITHNSKVGGVANSTHIKGLAVDIAFSNSHELFIIQKFAFVYGVKRMGINFAKNFIHIDFAMLDNGQYPQEVVFKY